MPVKPQAAHRVLDKKREREKGYLDIKGEKN
jgi:hypothetical protein